MHTSPSLLLPTLLLPLLLFLLHPTEREMEWLCRRGCVCHEESVQPVQSHLPLLAGQWQERPSLGLDWRARASDGWTLALETGQGTETIDFCYLFIYLFMYVFVLAVLHEVLLIFTCTWGCQESCEVGGGVSGASGFSGGKKKKNRMNILLEKVLWLTAEVFLWLSLVWNSNCSLNKLSKVLVWRIKGFQGRNPVGEFKIMLYIYI